MKVFRCLLLAAALAGCAGEDAPFQPRTVEDLKTCVRDEVNEGRGTAHPSVLGELSVAHCEDEIFRYARIEQAGAPVDRERALARTRELETELRAFALRYALGLES